jgi:hypothetical protein
VSTAIGLLSSFVPVYQSIDEADDSETYREQIRDPDLGVRDSKHNKHLGVFRLYAVTWEPGLLRVPYLKKKVK